MPAYTDIKLAYGWDTNQIRYTFDDAFYHSNSSLYAGMTGISSVADGSENPFELMATLWSNLANIEFVEDDTTPDIGVLRL